MTLVYLVRHARASAVEADYDKLHVEGELQARLLGEHLKSTAQQFDHCFVGPHLRQQETLRIARAAAGEIGTHWPVPAVVDGLAEAPYEILVKSHLVPRLATDPKLKALADALGAAADAGARDAVVRTIWDYMVVLWEQGEISADGLETSRRFVERVDDAFSRICARAREGRRTLVMTSNGVIGRILSSSAGTAPPNGQATHKLYNTSISIIELHGQRASLREANLIEHICDPALRTIL